MNPARVESGSARWAWRGVVLLVALVLAFGVVSAAERARSAPTTLGTALHLAGPQHELARAADALTAHNTPPGAADLALARRTAIAEPLAPLPFFVLGASAHARDAGAAMRAALARDPRFRPAYRWQAVTLAKAGDVGGATHALIRLAVLSPAEPQLWTAVAQLTADPAARKVIKSELAIDSSWQRQYLDALSASPVDRTVVFDMLHATGADTPAAPAGVDQDADHRQFIAAMVARKDYERAYLAWVEWLPAASQAAAGRVFDGDFKGVSALPPFAWLLPDGAGGATAIDAASGLALDYSSTDGSDLASQMVLLEPGRYRLATLAQFDAVPSDSGPPLVWHLACVADGKALGDVAVPLEGSAKRATGATFTVDAACPAQLLTLHVNPAEFAKRLSGHIRSVSIVAEGEQP